MARSLFDLADPTRARRWLLASRVTLALTWALMVLGALTRASLAGLACPDWPLCHGYLVPPLEAAAYPLDPSYLVHKVYLEFTHRVLAGLVSVGAVAVGLAAWRAGARRRALALGALLALQVAMGAATVWLKNAPSTVVLHLALALGFLAVLLSLHARLFATPRPSAPQARLLQALLLAALVAQLLVGAKVSSSYYALACPEFPLCEPGSWLPATWTAATAWQMAHRALGTLLLLGAAALVLARRGAARDRRLALELTTGLAAQVLLGALNVWLRVPPWASAAHLGLAVALFALLVRRLLESGGASRAEERLPRVAA